MEGGTPALPSLLDSAMRFLRWWRDELWGLVPARLRRLFADSHAGAVLAQVDTGFQLITEPSPRMRGGTGEVLSRAQAVAALAEMAASRRLGKVGIRLPLSQCFERRVELPRVAREDLRQMLNFDLERATPFRLGDVYTAHLATGEIAAKGKQRVRQLVVKRETIDALVAEVKAAGAEPAFADCWQTTPASGLPVNFLEANEPPRSGLATPPKMLAMLVVLLAGAACVLWPSRYEAALADVAAQTAKLRTAAAAVRSTIERSDAAVAELTRLQRMRLTRAPAVEILEELSRVLPDSVWLTDLRIQGDMVDISGLAKSGAALPSLFVGPGLFADASLTAPVTLDPREDKERFSLRLRVRQPETAQHAGAGKEQ